MSVTRVGIVYDLTTSRITRIVVPGIDEQLDDAVQLKPGEMISKMVMSVYQQFESVQSIATSLGLLQ